MAEAVGVGVGDLAGPGDSEPEGGCSASPGLRVVSYQFGIDYRIKPCHPMTPVPTMLLYFLEIVASLSRLSPESRQRLIETVSTWFQVKLPGTSSSPSGNPAPSFVGNPSLAAFGGNKPITAKQFLLEKEPRTDVERIACLAYYLTHYADTPQFKTLDLSRLNTEAAQPKFSNPAVAVQNAATMGYLVQAVKAHKQLSAAGERFVQALPDREAARAAMNSIKSRIRKRSSGKRAEED